MTRRTDISTTSLDPAAARSAPLPFIPRGLSRSESALYVGVGLTLFDEMVADGRMPRPKRVNSRTIWDRIELDAAFTNLPSGGGGLAELVRNSPKAKGMS